MAVRICVLYPACWCLLLAVVMTANSGLVSAQAEDVDYTQVSYYELLGVDPGADEKVLKRAYRKAARIHHPDKVKEADKEAAQAVFVRCVTAYEVLQDPFTRRRYDDLLKTGVVDYNKEEWAKYQEQRGMGRAYPYSYAEAQRRYSSERWDEETVTGVSLLLTSGFVGALGVFVVLAYSQSKKKDNREIAKSLIQDKVSQDSKSKASLRQLQEQREATIAQAQERAAQERQRLAQQPTTTAEADSELVRKAREREARRQQSRAHEATYKGPWTADELSALAKAVAKYPGGTHRRWEVVTEAVNCVRQAGSGRRSVKDVTRQAHDIAVQVKKQRPEDDAFERFVAHKQRSQKLAPEDTIGSGSTLAQGAATTGTPQTSQTAPGGTEPSSDADEWTPEQQMALELALRQHPPQRDKAANAERWRRIADCVEGKTRKQCVQRFKIVRAMLQKST